MVEASITVTTIVLWLIGLMTLTSAIILLSMFVLTVCEHRLRIFNDPQGLGTNNGKLV